jgi:4'-phosphopantetheinyl transferase
MIDIWQVYIPHRLAKVDYFKTILTGEENQRAKRFKFPRHQHRFILARGYLRLILSRYLPCPPQHLEFQYGPYGKPYLAERPLYFNVSHSQDYILYAISPSGEIGVDIEHHGPRTYMDSIVNQQFSEQEAHQYGRLEQQQRLASFYKGWVCKEAFIKGIGLGLSMPLNEFSVDMDPSKPAQLQTCSAQRRGQWQLTMLKAPPDYSAALAVNQPLEKLCYLKL